MKMELFQGYFNRNKSRFFSFLHCIILLLCVCFFSSCNNLGSFSKFAQDYLDDNMLVMVYVAGANSLNREVIMDINSMEKGLFLAQENGMSKLKVVALVDKDISIGSESWTGSVLYEIEPHNTDLNSIKIHSKVIETASNSLGEWRTSSNQEEHMGNINTLENFILWARESYPEYRKHALILWNHGGGVYSDFDPLRNICTDLESGPTSESLDNTLYIAEISQLLDRLYPSDSSLEFLGMDACLMGMYEIAYQFRNSVKYMAFSPAIETGGWNYEYIFSQSDSNESGKNFAINVVDGYKKAYSSGYPNNTMTAVDLQFVTDLKTEIDNLSFSLGQDFLTDKTAFKEKIEKVRDNSIVMHLNDVFFATNLLRYPYYELGSLLRCFANENPTLRDDNKIEFSVSTESAAWQVQVILEKMILKTWLGGGYGNAYIESENLKSNFVFEENIPYGISIFFSNKNNFLHHGFYTSEESGTPGVLGYGCIDAANKTDNGTIDTWYELQYELFNLD